MYQSSDPAVRSITSNESSEISPLAPPSWKRQPKSFLPQTQSSEPGALYRRRLGRGFWQPSLLPLWAGAGPSLPRPRLRHLLRVLLRLLQACSQLPIGGKSGGIGAHCVYLIRPCQQHGAERGKPMRSLRISDRPPPQQKLIKPMVPARGQRKAGRRLEIRGRRRLP